MARDDETSALELHIKGKYILKNKEYNIYYMAFNVYFFSKRAKFISDLGET